MQVPSLNYNIDFYYIFPITIAETIKYNLDNTNSSNSCQHTLSIYLYYYYFLSAVTYMYILHKFIQLCTQEPHRASINVCKFIHILMSVCRYLLRTTKTHAHEADIYKLILLNVTKALIC